MAVAFYKVTHPATGREITMGSLVSDQTGELTLQPTNESFEGVAPNTTLIFYRISEGTGHPLDLGQELNRRYRATAWHPTGDGSQVIISQWEPAA